MHLVKEVIPGLHSGHLMAFTPKMKTAKSETHAHLHALHIEALHCTHNEMPLSAL